MAATASHDMSRVVVGQSEGEGVGKGLRLAPQQNVVTSK